ncbi:hypothetical protein AKH77_14500 [Listeria monocytogenes]|nr:hypothetical protein [Listeria monocytogenes]EAD8738556.1 hypothetical protein [Listeria monocytogenes]EAD8751198.1 hypothetical protein [Listeria monocytogenes]EAE9216565.1 hypothetical protein [Listeria monocytogenes]
MIIPISKMIRRLKLDEKTTRYTWTLTISVLVRRLVEAMTAIFIVGVGFIGMQSWTTWIEKGLSGNEVSTKYLKGMADGYTVCWMLLYFVAFIFLLSFVMMRIPSEKKWWGILTIGNLFINSFGLSAWLFNPYLNNQGRKHVLILLGISIFLVGIVKFTEWYLKRKIMKDIIKNWPKENVYLTDFNPTEEQIKDSILPINHEWERYIISDEIFTVRYKCLKSNYKRIQKDTSDIQQQKGNEQLIVTRKIKINQAVEMDMLKEIRIVTKSHPIVSKIIHPMEATKL